MHPTPLGRQITAYCAWGIQASWQRHWVPVFCKAWAIKYWNCINILCADCRALWHWWGSVLGLHFQSHGSLDCCTTPTFWPAVVTYWLWYSNHSPDLWDCRTCSGCFK